MKKEFTKEDIKNLAKLSMIRIDDAELESYIHSLNKKIQIIKGIKEIELERDILIAPFTEKVKMREDRAEASLKTELILENANSKAANMIEVPVMLND